MRTKANARLGAIVLVLTAATVATAMGRSRPGDSEAIATIIAIDSAAIIHADLAMTKKLSDPVLAWVQDIRGDHADDAEEIADIARDIEVHPLASAGVRTIEGECDELVRTLDELDGPAFEKAYLAAMITGHANAIATVDRLLRMDLSDGVKGHLKDMRERGQKHMQKAKALRTG